MTNPTPGAHDLMADTEATHPPDIVATEAIEAALATAPRGGTVEAKANHVYVELTSNGWALIPEAAAAEGNVHVLGPDEQIVTVPDGHVIDFRPIDPDPENDLVDPELSELAVIVARLESLTPDARERVAAYITDRFAPTAAPSWPFTPGSWLTTDEAKARVTTTARHVGGVVPRHQIGKEIT